MKNKGLQYAFSAKVYHYSTSADMVGWRIVSLPKEIAMEIRDNFKHLEQGWGRMKVTAKVGNREWQTAICFDTKHDTYFHSKQQSEKKKTLHLVKMWKLSYGFDYANSGFSLCRIPQRSHP